MSTIDVPPSFGTPSASTTGKNTPTDGAYRPITTGGEGSTGDSYTTAAAASAPQNSGRPARVHGALTGDKTGTGPTGSATATGGPPSEATKVLGTKAVTSTRSPQRPAPKGPQLPNVEAVLMALMVAMPLALFTVMPLAGLFGIGLIGDAMLLGIAIVASLSLACIVGIFDSARFSAAYRELKNACAEQTDPTDEVHAHLSDEEQEVKAATTLPTLSTDSSRNDDDGAPAKVDESKSGTDGEEATKGKHGAEISKGDAS